MNRNGSAAKSRGTHGFAVAYTLLICLTAVVCSHMKNVHRDALDALAGHPALRYLVFTSVLPPSVANIRAAIMRLLERAKQGNELTIEVPEEVFTEQQAAAAVKKAASARRKARTHRGCASYGYCCYC
jgi:hypothetical protein